MFRVPWDLELVDEISLSFRKRVWGDLSQTVAPNITRRVLGQGLRTLNSLSPVFIQSFLAYLFLSA
jgi:hypothetical protein